MHTWCHGNRMKQLKKKKHWKFNKIHIRYTGFLKKNSALVRFQMEVKVVILLITVKKSYGYIMPHLATRSIVYNTALVKSVS